MAPGVRFITRLAAYTADCTQVHHAYAAHDWIYRFTLITVYLNNYINLKAYYVHKQTLACPLNHSILRISTAHAKADMLNR